MRDSKINIKKAVEILRHDYMGNIRLALENIFKKNYLAESSITFVKQPQFFISSIILLNSRLTM